MDLKTVLSDEDKVLGSYRHDVADLLPKATRIAWSLKKDEIMKDQPGVTKKKFLYNLSRASYQKNWGTNYQPPTLGERFLAFLVTILPKIGPLKVLQLRTPTPETERMFEASFNTTLDRYRKLLSQVSTGVPDLPNDNFDTGGATGPGKYLRSTMRLTQSFWPRSPSRTLPVLRRTFGPSFWNSTGIRMLPTRPNANQKSGLKFRLNLNNCEKQLRGWRSPAMRTILFQRSIRENSGPVRLRGTSAAVALAGELADPADRPRPGAASPIR